MVELTCFYCGAHFYSDDPETDETIRVGPYEDRIGCRNDWCIGTRREHPIRKARKKPIAITVEGPIKIEREIYTLEGHMLASVGDYIITGVNGEKYPIKPDVFEKTYDIVEDEE